MLDQVLIQVTRNKNDNKVNMIQERPDEHYVYDIREYNRSLVEMHDRMSEIGYFSQHDYSTCKICSQNIHGYLIVVDELQGFMDRGIIGPIRRKVGNAVNMVDGCPGSYIVYDVYLVRGSLVRIHDSLTKLAYFGHKNDYATCETFLGAHVCVFL